MVGPWGCFGLGSMDRVGWKTKEKGAGYGGGAHALWPLPWAWRQRWRWLGNDPPRLSEMSSSALLCLCYAPPRLDVFRTQPSAQPAPAVSSSWGTVSPTSLLDHVLTSPGAKFSWARSVWATWDLFQV